MDIYNFQVHGSQFRIQVISHHFIMSKAPVLMHDFSIGLHQYVLFYFLHLIIAQLPNDVKFLSVYNHVLWRLVVTLETVTDMMIDIYITRTNHTCTIHIRFNEHLFYHDYPCIHVKL